MTHQVSNWLSNGSGKVQKKFFVLYGWPWKKTGVRDANPHAVKNLHVTFDSPQINYE